MAIPHTTLPSTRNTLTLSEKNSPYFVYYISMFDLSQARVEYYIFLIIAVLWNSKRVTYYYYMYKSF